MSTLYGDHAPLRELELEGFELVDTWEDTNDYWVYYRLSKNHYQNIKQQKLEKVMSLALDMFNNARINEQQGRLSNALTFYLQALKQLKDYVSEPLQIELNGVKVFLMNEIYASIQYILSNTELRAREEKQIGKIGQPLKSEPFSKITGWDMAALHQCLAEQCA